MVEATKLFHLHCNRCSYSEYSTGLNEDLKHLFELKACSQCHGKRKFRCPKCGTAVLLKRLAGNDQVKPNQEGDATETV